MERTEWVPVQRILSFQTLAELNNLSEQRKLSSEVPKTAALHMYRHKGTVLSLQCMDWLYSTTIYLKVR